MCIKDYYYTINGWTKDGREFYTDVPKDDTDQKLDRIIELLERIAMPPIKVEVTPEGEKWTPIVPWYYTDIRYHYSCPASSTGDWWART